MIGIYKITNLINGKVYIGLSTNIEKRWNKHRTAPFNPKNKNYNLPLYKAIRKYGLKCFKFEVLCECKECELSDLEVAYIAQHNANDERFGYNLTEGGQCAKHPIKLSIDVISQIIDRLKHSTETNQVIADEFAISERMVRSINCGECWAIEGESYPIRSVRYRSPNGTHATPKKMLKNNKCNQCGSPILSESTYCKKCSGTINGERARKTQRPGAIELARMILETSFLKVGKEFEVSDSAIKSWCRDYHIPDTKQELIVWYSNQTEAAPLSNNRLKPIKQINIKTGTVVSVYANAYEAARQIGNVGYVHNIIDACNGKNKTSHGYRWEYL